MIRFPGRILLALAAVVLVVLPGALAAYGRPPDVPEPVFRARLAYVGVGRRESGWFSDWGFLVAPGRVVTHSHGPVPDGSPGDEYVVYLIAYGIGIKGIRLDPGRIRIDIDRLPSVRARYRCLDGYHAYIMWDVLDPLPEDLPVLPVSNDRRGLLYVLNNIRPYLHRAYAEHGQTDTVEGRTAQMPVLQLVGPAESDPRRGGSMVVNARGEAVGMIVGKHRVDQRLALISPAEAWNCPFGMVRR